MHTILMVWRRPEKRTTLCIMTTIRSVIVPPSNIVALKGTVSLRPVRHITGETRVGPTKVQTY